MALIETIPVKQDYRRKMAQKLMEQATSAEPIQHWAQGLARLGQGAIGGYSMYQADQRDKETEAGNNAALIAALSGGAPATPSAEPTPQQPTAQPMPPVSSVTPSAGAVPAALTGGRPGGPVMPSNKVWGDKEAEAAGIYEKPAQTAALSSMVPTPVKTEAIAPTPAAAPAIPMPTDPQMADAKARLVQMLQSDNPQMRKMGQNLAQALIMQQAKPNEYDFKVVGDNLVRTDKRGAASVVPGMSASKPQWADTGEIDPTTGQPVKGWVNPGDKSVTPYRPQSANAGPSTIPPAPAGVDPKVWREAQSKRATEEAMPASGDSASKLRNEVQGLPSYKNIAQAAPVYKSMLEAAGRDTRAADVNMIYGMAKIMDPGSVVRESEMTVAQAIATLPQQLQATVQSQLTSTGRLTPEVREAIMQEAHSRINAYQGMFEQDAGMYRGIAQRSRMNEADVLPAFGPYEQYKRAAKPTEPVVIDGYKIKAR